MITSLTSEFFLKKTSRPTQGARPRLNKNRNRYSRYWSCPHILFYLSVFVRIVPMTILLKTYIHTLKFIDLPRRQSKWKSSSSIVIGLLIIKLRFPEPLALILGLYICKDILFNVYLQIFIAHFLQKICFPSHFIFLNKK